MSKDIDMSYVFVMTTIFLRFARLSGKAHDNPQENILLSFHHLSSSHLFKLTSV